MSKFHAESQYRQLKAIAPEIYENIVAFASTFGNGEEEISVATRYQVERYCIATALEAMNRVTVAGDRPNYPPLRWTSEHT